MPQLVKTSRATSPGLGIRSFGEWQRECACHGFEVLGERASRTITKEVSKEQLSLLSMHCALGLLLAHHLERDSIAITHALLNLQHGGGHGSKQKDSVADSKAAPLPLLF